MSIILLEIDMCMKGMIDSCVNDYGNELTIINSNRFDGQNELMQILITLGGVSIYSIAKIITEAIRSKKYVTIKKNGMEISGISEKNILKILGELNEKD